MEADPIGPNSAGLYQFHEPAGSCAVATPAGTTAVGLPWYWPDCRDTDKALVHIVSNGPLRVIRRGGTFNLLGAHMSGLPLNKQVLGLGARFVREVHTAPLYKMIYLPTPAPHRPGIIRVGVGGTSIAAEEWRFPKAALGEFLSTIQQPLGLSQVELSDGRKVHGFVCEAHAAEGAQDISASGGWRGYLS